MDEYLIGKVVDIEDPNKIGRIRCEVLGRSEGLKKEVLPWYVPMDWDKDTFDLPKIDEYVYIYLWNNDIHTGSWKLREHDDRFKDLLSDSDYKSAKIILRRYLDDWETEGGDDIGGLLALYYTLTDGFMMQLKESKINIERDSSIWLYCEKLKKQIHIFENQISLGQKNKSAQPIPCGNDMNDQFTLTKEWIDWLANHVSETWKKLAQLASSSPYTAHLAPGFTQGATTIDSTNPQHKSKFEQHLPENLSELCSLDKYIDTEGETFESKI